MFQRADNMDLSQFEKKTALVVTSKGEVYAARTEYYEGDTADDSGWLWVPVWQPGPLNDPDLEISDEPLFDDDTGRSNVTHFMPLPAPPKDER